MVRPGRGAIELVDGGVSRRRLLGLAAAGAGAALGGCGGNGSANPGTPALERGEIPPVTYEGGTVTDSAVHAVTTANFEKFTPNAWHPQAGVLPPWQRLPLATVPETAQLRPGADPTSIVLPGAARQVTLDRNAGAATFHLREDLTWSDGTAFDAENVRLYWTIVRALAAVGDTSTRLESVSVVDDTTIRATFPPGNPALGLYEAIFRGGLTDVSTTHPEFHREYVEAIEDATTAAETDRAVQDLLEAQFPKDRLDELALGPFVPTDWDPTGATFKARGEFPWGLGHREVTRLFQGVQIVSLTAGGGQAINAAISGRQDFFTLSLEEAFDRFPDGWELHTAAEPAGATLYFSPDSRWGARTERARRLRRALAYLLDPAPAARITGVVPAAEQTAGFFRAGDFRAWLGDAFEGFTDYGTRADGYDRSASGFELLREAGFERADDGWVDAGGGEPLAPRLSARTGPGLSRFVVGRLVQDLRERGIDVRRGESGEPDLLLLPDQAGMYPHPYFGFRDDCGLGSGDLGPAIDERNWRNGYRRVEVPMPVGDPDGDPATYDWDAKVRELGGMTDAAAIRERVRELSWVLNQWVPGVLLFARTYHATVNTARLAPTPAWGPGLWPRAGLSVASLLALGYLEPP